MMCVWLLIAALLLFLWWALVNWKFLLICGLVVEAWWRKA